MARSKVEIETATRGREYEAHSLEVGGGFPRYHDWLMTLFEPHLRGRVIEVGAGVGTIAARYVDLATESLLLEPATNLHDTLARKFASKPNVHTGCAYLDDAVGKDFGGLRASPGTFDAAVMVNVLEHIEDDLATLRTVHTMLKPGGRLILFVPALPVLYGVIDTYVGHIRRYTRRSLEDVVTRAGLRPSTLQYFDLLGALPWFITGRVLRRAKVDPESARVYDRFVVPVSRVVDRLTGPRVGKNLALVAEKPLIA